MRFIEVPDPLFGWTKEDILLWGQKRYSSNPRDVEESYKIAKFYKDIYDETCASIEQGEEVRKFESRKKDVRPVNNFDYEKVYLTEDEWDEVSCKFTHSPRAESYVAPQPFSETIREELEVRDEMFKERRRRSIYDNDYDFDPAEYVTDAKIPKGQVLQKLREACKDEKSHSP